VLVFGRSREDNREQKSVWLVATAKKEDKADSVSRLIANTSGDMETTLRAKFDSREIFSVKYGDIGVSTASAELRDPQITNTSRDAYMGESTEDLMMRSMALTIEQDPDGLLAIANSFSFLI
jgi:hypothetical protein